MERRVSFYTLSFVFLSFTLYAITLGQFVRPEATLTVRIDETLSITFGAFLMWLLGERT